MKERIEDLGWKRMKTLLDDKQPSVAPLMIRLLPYAAVLVLGLLSGILFLQDNGFMDNNGQIVNLSSPSDIQVVDLPTFDVFEDIAAASPNGVEAYPQQFTAEVNQIHSEGALFRAPAHRDQQGMTANQNTVQPKSILEKVLSFPTKSQPIVESKKQETLLAENAGPKKSALFIDESSTTESYDSDKLEKTVQPKASTTSTGAQGISLPVVTLKSALKGKNGNVSVSGSLGVVSSGFEEYGYRAGLELEKPIGKRVSVTSGIRYSRYSDDYEASYDINANERDLRSGVLKSLISRDVERDFYEVPVSLNYKVNEAITMKGGFAVTYNTNDASAPKAPASAVLTNSTLSQNTRNIAQTLYRDHEGYLGEAVVGANVDIDRISLEAEIMKGLISNNPIDDRNIVGVRLSYRFGKK